MDWYVTLKQNQSTVVKAFGRGSAGTLSQMPKSWNVFRLRFYVLDLELAPFPRAGSDLYRADGKECWFNSILIHNEEE